MRSTVEYMSSKLCGLSLGYALMPILVMGMNRRQIIFQDMGGYGRRARVGCGISSGTIDANG